jgi:tetratricopeptide (TPR) repeat protein
MDQGTSHAGFFVAGGTLRPDVRSYVQRPTDDELFELALAGEYCYVLTPRQMGKSSLMVRTARRLENQGATTAIIDLTRIGSSASVEQWYLSLLSQLTRRLRLRFNTVAWWETHVELSPAQRLADFVREVVLVQVAGQIVVFIDEIDATLGLDWRDEFFAAIRALYNARAEDAEYGRLTFVLLGVASPPDLIRDTALTPFNIGHGIALQEFSTEDSHVLYEGLEAVHPGQGEAILERILYWTSGHPYLTQRLCLAAVESTDGRWTDKRVDALVERLFLAEQARKETNLQFVQDKILNDPNSGRLLGLYKRVLKGRTVRDDVQSPVQTQLKLSGIVTAENGVLRVRNNIYRQVFGLDWVRENMPVNWARRIAVVSTVLLMIVATVLGIRWSQRDQQTTEVQAQVAIQGFQDTLSSDVRITNLAYLFQLDGYEDRARTLFEDLTSEEQIKLFTEVNAQAVPSELRTVVQGLYTDLVDDKQGNALLEVMAQSLRELDDAAAVNLAAEIEQWVKGRNYYAQGEYRAAVAACDAAIGLNADNAGALFDLGRVRAALGQADFALANWERVVQLDKARSQQVMDQVAADSRLYAAWWENWSQYSNLSGMIATPTSTPTPTDTPTVTRTPLSTHTPTPTETLAPTETSTAAPTSTSPSTHTPSPTSAPTNTATPASTPSPTPQMLPASTLLAPSDGASFTGWNAVVVLQWSGVGNLGADEYYVVRVPYNEAGDTAEFWRRETSMQVPPHFSLATVGFPDRHYDWSVQVMRCTNNCDRVLDDNTRKQGVVVGGKSSTRRFYWHSDIGGEPPRPTTGPGETPGTTPRPPTPTPQ